jgi:hypothetical protein
MVLNFKWYNSDTKLSKNINEHHLSMFLLLHYCYVFVQLKKVKIFIKYN